MLAIPDRILSERPYLGGAQLTMGDIPLGCHVQLWMRLPESEMRGRPRQPNLEAWFARLCERPAYRKIVDIPLS
jgi:glutathione S-transferase